MRIRFFFINTRDFKVKSGHAYIETETEKHVLPVRPGRADKRKLVKVKSAVTFNYRFV